jgi:methionyl aminopeptidase
MSSKSKNGALYAPSKWGTPQTTDESLNAAAPVQLEKCPADACQERHCAAAACKHLGRYRCPVCTRLGFKGPPAFFCSVACFNRTWPLHQRLHLALLARSLQRNHTATVNEVNDSAADPPPCFHGYAGYTGPLRPWKVTPQRAVPPTIPRPDYAETGVSAAEEAAKRSNQIPCLRPHEIEGMRRACRLAREVLDLAGKAVDVGVTTDELDSVVHEACIARGAYPSPLNYYGFPKSCCTSVNEVICHGIPDCRPLEDGDIVNIDVTLYVDGFHGDLNETFLVGHVDRASRILVKNAYDCLQAGIRIVKPGLAFRDIGAAVEEQAQKLGHNVVRTYCGHGIHRLFHAAPNIPHYRKNKTPGVARAGNTFTIEPMICQGSARDVLWPDQWTAVTSDGGRSAQFEETLLVTNAGVEVLTAKTDASPRYFWERPDWDQD